MSKCKSCGAEIIWIKTAGGKNMPCNAERVYYKQDFKYGNLVLVLPNGKIDRGNLDFESDKFGYTSHFATCPSANQHRKRDTEQISMQIGDVE